MFCWPCISKYACNETNLMHCISSLYWDTTPLHISGLLVAHHQEVSMYVCENWYVLYVLRCVHTVTLSRTVTPYRDCGQESRPRNVSKVGYAVTLLACSVRCRYLAVALKGWYGYGLSRSGRATWHVTTVRSSRLLYIPDASGSRNKQWTPWCNARRILLRREARDEIWYLNSVSCQLLSTLQNYGTL
jgi:hypothetical protein